jgi:hypothetical protein
LEYAIDKRRDYQVLLKKNRDNSDNYKKKKTMREGKTLGR